MYKAEGYCKAPNEGIKKCQDAQSKPGGISAEWCDQELIAGKFPRPPSPSVSHLPVKHCHSVQNLSAGEERPGEGREREMLVREAVSPVKIQEE